MADNNVQAISIPVILSKKFDGVIYNLMVRTITDQVYRGDYTLTEILADIETLLGKKADDSDLRKVRKKLNTFLADAPEDFQTILDIYNYINSKSENAETRFTELEKILGQKVDASTYKEEREADKEWCASQIESLKNAMLEYSKEFISTEVFNLRLEQLEKEIREDMNRNILASDTEPDNLIDGGFWIQTL